MKVLGLLFVQFLLKCKNSLSIRTASTGLSQRTKVALQSQAPELLSTFLDAAS